MRKFQERYIKGQHDRRLSILAEGRTETKGVCSLWEDERQKELLKKTACWGQVGRSSHAVPAGRGLRWLSGRQDHPDHQRRLGARGRGPREGSPTGRASDHRLGVSGTQLPGRSPRPWARHVPVRRQASPREHHYCRLNPCPALAPGPEEICGPAPSSGPTCAHPPL